MKTQSGLLSDVLLEQFNMLYSTKLKVFERLWFVTSLFVSLVGLVCQVYHISDRYFKYATIADVRLAKPTILEPLQIVACFATSNENSSRFQPRYGHDTVDEYLRNQPPPHEMIVTSQTRAKTQSGHYEIKMFIKAVHLCYAMSFNETIDKKLLLSESKSRAYAHLTFDRNLTSGHDNIRWFLIPYGMNLYGDPEGFMEHSRDLDQNRVFGEKNKVRIGYKMYTQTLLGPPYDTNCLDYYHSTSGNCESQEECIEQCEVELAGQRVLFNGSLGTRKERDYVISDQKPNRRLTIACEQRYPRPNCNKVEYIPDIMDTIASEYAIGAVMLPREPDIVAVARPQIELLDFLTYIASCFSFWIGFCPFTFMLFIFRVTARRQSNDHSPKCRNTVVSRNLIRMEIARLEQRLMKREKEKLTIYMNEIRALSSLVAMLDNRMQQAANYA